MRPHWSPYSQDLACHLSILAGIDEESNLKAR